MEATNAATQLPFVQALIRSVNAAPNSLPDAYVVVSQLRLLAENGTIYARNQLAREEPFEPGERQALEWQLGVQEELKLAVEHALVRFSSSRSRSVDDLWKFFGEELSLGAVRVFADLAHCLGVMRDEQLEFSQLPSSFRVVVIRGLAGPAAMLMTSVEYAQIDQLVDAVSRMDEVVAALKCEGPRRAALEFLARCLSMSTRSVRRAIAARRLGQILPESAP